MVNLGDVFGAVPVQIGRIIRKELRARIFRHSISTLGEKPMTKSMVEIKPRERKRGRWLLPYEKENVTRSSIRICAMKKIFSLVCREYNMMM